MVASRQLRRSTVSGLPRRLDCQRILWWMFALLPPSHRPHATLLRCLVRSQFSSRWAARQRCPRSQASSSARTPTPSSTFHRSHARPPSSGQGACHEMYAVVRCHCDVVSYSPPDPRPDPFVASPFSKSRSLTGLPPPAVTSQWSLPPSSTPTACYSILNI